MKEGKEGGGGDKLGEKERREGGENCGWDVIYVRRKTIKKKRLALKHFGMVS